MTRSVKFVENEFYHVYNRGVEKRDIFLDRDDIERFLMSIQVLNSIDPIGSLYELSFKEKQLGDPVSKLVDVVAYCLNPNHYHLLLKQVSENGISKFMHRLGISHTLYFNEKNKRSGVLFQGKFKAIHANNNEYLLHLSAYINLNYKVHNEWGGEDGKKQLTRSSWDEYVGLSEKTICEKSVILSQFGDKKSYEEFALSSLEDIKERRLDIITSAHKLE